MRRYSRKSAGRKNQVDRSTSQKHFEVVTEWQHTQENNPAFARLMSLLLQPREANTSKEKKEAENER